MHETLKTFSIEGNPFFHKGPKKAKLFSMEGVNLWQKIVC